MQEIQPNIHGIAGSYRTERANQIEFRSDFGIRPNDGMPIERWRWASSLNDSSITQELSICSWPVHLHQGDRCYARVFHSPVGGCDSHECVLVSHPSSPF